MSSGRQGTSVFENFASGKIPRMGPASFNKLRFACIWVDENGRVMSAAGVLQSPGRLVEARIEHGDDQGGGQNAKVAERNIHHDYPVGISDGSKGQNDNVIVPGPISAHHRYLSLSHDLRPPRVLCSADDNVAIL